VALTPYYLADTSALARSNRPVVAEKLLDRGVEVQDALASESQHRGAKIADLIIAAAAEAAALVVLHYDRDFDLIASVTG
jgi:predicted nucleic acid-binding protein